MGDQTKDEERKARQRKATRKYMDKIRQDPVKWRQYKEKEKQHNRKKMDRLKADPAKRAEHKAKQHESYLKRKKIIEVDPAKRAEHKAKQQAANRKYKAKVKTDPIKSQELKTKMAERRRLRFRENTAEHEKYKKSMREYHVKVMADPVKHNILLAQQKEAARRRNTVLLREIATAIPYQDVAGSLVGSDTGKKGNALEDLVGRMFLEWGCRPLTVDSDGGVDLWFEAPSGQIIAIQCKAHRVSLQHIQSFTTAILLVERGYIHHTSLPSSTNHIISVFVALKHDISMENMKSLRRLLPRLFLIDGSWIISYYKVAGLSTGNAEGGGKL